MPDPGEEEQVVFEVFDDGDRPYYSDRPPEKKRPPALRPDQMLLPIPALDVTFVVPRWTTDDVPARWTFLAADIDGDRLTELRGRFLFRRDADDADLAVSVAWSTHEARFTATTTAPDTGLCVEGAADDDMVQLKAAVLARVQRFADLQSLVGAAAITPATHALILEAIGALPDHRPS